MKEGNPCHQCGSYDVGWNPNESMYECNSCDFSFSERDEDKDEDEDED